MLAVPAADLLPFQLLKAVPLPRFEMDDLQRFKPERWLNKDAARDGAWMPFGGGPRLCLGNLLSLAELKIFLSLLIRG